MNTLIFLAVIQAFSSTGAYDFSCPSQAHWSLRAKSSCIFQSNYSCLFDVNSRINVFRDKCIRPRIVGPGYKYVFQPNPNRDICSQSRFQPFIFNTIGYSDCVFLKSLCNSEGLKTHEDGTTRSDKTCTCNTEKGFNFVGNPTNKCFCNPSSEDCSCFHSSNTNNRKFNLTDLRCHNEVNNNVSQSHGVAMNKSQAFKNNDFDNFEYNLVCPTHQYRTKAVVCILILALSYFPVVVGLYFFLRRIQSWIYTPKNFDISEIADCSMTIAWDIKYSERNLKYELCHRHKTSDTWNVLKIYTENVVRREDGRHLYSLEELSPETRYELKMCSFDIHQVKSQYTKSLTRKTLKMAPANFEIVECTDISVTIAWDIPKSHECLEYEIEQRLEGSDKWETLRLLSANAETWKDGRLMYKLGDLSQDKWYKVRMCSVDNQKMKSHFTKPQSNKTLTTGLLKAVNQLREEDRKRYIELMQQSETENRYFVKIMIVGKQGVGKTCLLRRLLKESIDGVTSTDGVDIVVRRCKINVEDGKWTIDKDIPDDGAIRIMKAVAQGTKTVTSRNWSGVSNNSTISKSELEPVTPSFDTNNLETSDDRYVSSDKLSTYTNDNKDTIKVVENFDEIDTESVSSMTNNEYVTNTDTGDSFKEKEDVNNQGHLIMPSDLMSDVFSSVSTSNIPLNHYALCGLWDFAGQKEFYGTHQAFLTSSAIYLVVANMDTDVWNKNEEKLEKTGKEDDFQIKQKAIQDDTPSFADIHVGEYVDFWFDSIHCYQTNNIPVNGAQTEPPVIVVFTGKDTYEEADMKTRQEQLNEQFSKLIGNQKKYRHYRHKYYISNTEDSEEVFENLRIKISEIAKEMHNWGTSVPLKWILLEHLIAINKRSGKKFITFDDVVKIAKHPQIGILDIEEVSLFLHFQREVGQIIYFEDIRNLIILDPQWLANAFRCLVSDRLNIDAVDVKEKSQLCLDWTDLKDKGIISDLLINTLFKLKEGNQFLEQRGNLLEVMKRFDILVEIADTHSYIMPSMLPSTSFNTVFENIGIFEKNCRRTSWFCLKFKFLPPSFFNHLSVWLMIKYKPSKVEQNKNSFALYRGFCVFDFEKSGCYKLLMTMSKDTIALQVVAFRPDKKDLCSIIRKELLQKIEDIKKRYKLEISYEQEFKCSECPYHIDAMSFEVLKTNMYFYCLYHKQAHESKEIYLSWTTESTELTMATQAATPIQSTIPVDLQTRSNKMKSSSRTGPPGYLEDTKKRWLVVGICLHSILTPVLRKYVDHVVTTLYNTLKLSDQIHLQTHPTHLRTYGAASNNLNYEAINYNKTTQGHRKDLWDYKVQNSVDLSKLFLQTYMAHYTAFDESCDSSALLGMIIKIDKFPVIVQRAATSVRSAVRNPWVHCIFTEWDEMRYNSSLQQIEDFIYLLNLDVAEESLIIRKLRTWRTYGLELFYHPTQQIQELDDDSKTLATCGSLYGDLDDNNKRWLVVGICLHSILSPALRKYVDHIVTNLYSSLKTSDKIDLQTLTTYLRSYGLANIYLNYEAINNNKLIHGDRAVLYDYKVQNAVELSKLFLMTQMTHYTAFDESCDLSALLRMIDKIDKFPGNVQMAARDIISTIRNPWARCNFTEWNEMRYNSSLQHIEYFIYLLNLDVSEESQIIRELRTWRTNGTSFLQGTIFGHYQVYDQR